MRFNASMFIWQSPRWPALTWDSAVVTPALARARLAQGHMLGLAASLGLAELGELQLPGWTREAVATAQIEGEVLQLNSVRASAARRLGLAPQPRSRDARAEATLDVVQAAFQGWDKPLDPDTIFGWHAALFPTGRSGISRIVTGGWRTHAEPMRIVTAKLGRPDVVHYQAPGSPEVPGHMGLWLEWFERVSVQHQVDALVRAAISHLWFEAIHPFEDGNGRIGRALAERALAQDMRSGQRLFSLSDAILADRAGYYAQLQAATGSDRMDITPWVHWFLERTQSAFEAAVAQMDTARLRNRYWSAVNAMHEGISATQRKALGRLLDAQPQGFVGGMSTEKYVNLTGVSRATAYRELTQLAEWGLIRREGQGRGTRYHLVDPAGR